MVIKYMDINKTIPQNFFDTARQHEKKRALSYKKDGAYCHLSYQELARKVKEFSSGLQKMGVKRGDKVAVFSANRPEWAIADLAIMAAGAVNVPVHATLSPRIIGFILNHCEAKFLIVAGEDLLNKFFLVREKLPVLEKIIYAEKISDEQRKLTAKELVEWEEVAAAGATGTKIGALPATEADDIASIIYTSGTTGLPKGVCLTHRNFISNVTAILKSVPIYSSDRFLSFLPLSHILERTGGYYIALLVGAEIAYAESFKDLGANLKEVHPTILACVPRVFERFYDKIWNSVKTGSKLKKKLFYFALQSDRNSWRGKAADAVVLKKIRKHLGGNLRFAISGGAPLDPKIAKFFGKIGVLILEGYGLTETSPVLAVNKTEACRFGSVGQPLEGQELKITSEKEIIARGPHLMRGYYRDEEETAKAIDEDGWFHTGDLGFLDSDNYLTIIGRKKEMMVTAGGKNIWPEPLEQMLNLDKYINQSMIVAHRRKFVGALIVPDWKEIQIYLKGKGNNVSDPRALISDREVLDLFGESLVKMNADLPDWEQVKNFILLPDEFSQERDELSPTLKLCRHNIEKNYRREIERIYQIG